MFELVLGHLPITEKMSELMLGHLQAMYLFKLLGYY